MAPPERCLGFTHKNNFVKVQRQANATQLIFGYFKDDVRQNYMMNTFNLMIILFVKILWKQQFPLIYVVILLYIVYISCSEWSGEIKPCLRFSYDFHYIISNITFLTNIKLFHY